MGHDGRKVCATSTRCFVLKTLAKFPDGISARRLKILVMNNRAVSGLPYLNSVLSQEVKNGLVQRAGRKDCECCGAPYMTYKITPKGQAIIDGA